MKKNLIILSTFLFIIGAVACKKNTYNVTERTEVTNKALVKIGYFSPSINNQNVQLKVNGTRVSPLLIYNTPFPGGGLNTLGSSNSDFLLFEPGSNAFAFAVPKAGTDVDSVKVFESQFDLKAQRQTLFLTDSFPNITALLVNDETTAPTDSGKARIKFVHLIPNVPAVDFYRNNVLLKANIPYKGVTEYEDVFAGSVTYAIREAGSATNLATRAINPTAGRIYTFFSRGFKGATGTLVPNVSAMVVQ